MSALNVEIIEEADEIYREIRDLDRLVERFGPAMAAAVAAPDSGPSGL